MKDLFMKVLEKAKDMMTLTATLVFVLSGVYLRLIDGSDLKTKDMPREFKLTQIISVIYIVGAAAAFILLRLV